MRSEITVVGLSVCLCHSVCVCVDACSGTTGYEAALELRETGCRDGVMNVLV